MPPFRCGLAASFLLLAGCAEFGKVNQGQVIDYRRDTGVVTLIEDSNYRDGAHPRFDVLPPVTVQTPENPKEMGAAPEAGKLLRLDVQGRRMAIYNSTTRRIEKVAYREVNSGTSCGPVPVVDRARKTIALCAGHQAMVVSVADEYFALPDDTWKVGDEVRYYYKDPARALRLMNVTKTNLNKAE